MAAFLLWNVHRRPTLDGLVERLVVQHQIDIVLLVEYATGLSQLPGLLLANGHTHIRQASPDKFGVFVRATHTFRPLRHPLDKRAKLWRWIPPGGQEGLIALVHGYDRRHYSNGTRRLLLRHVHDAIRYQENRLHHKRSVVAGDFNAHPFESAVTSADGLHAMGVRSIRGRGSRRIRGAAGRTDFFYNLMWRLYGQQSAHDAGTATHHWMRNQVHEFGWHMLDQVVIRPGETDRFPENHLQVVTRVGGISLLDAAGRPDVAVGSDHLPVVFHWNL